jgi:hypothetical protein
VIGDCNFSQISGKLRQDKNGGDSAEVGNVRGQKFRRAPAPIRHSWWMNQYMQRESINSDFHQ